MKAKDTFYLDNPLGHRAMYQNNPEDTFDDNGEIKSIEALDELRQRTRLGDPVAMRIRMAGMRKGEEQAEIDKEYIEKADKALQKDMARLSAELDQAGV